MATMTERYPKVLHLRIGVVATGCRLDEDGFVAPRLAWRHAKFGSEHRILISSLLI